MPSEHDKIDSQKVIGSLNTILELELAGVVRYVHYSLMVFGHARIPIIGWMRNQAIEGMNHASIADEHVTSLGGHPSLKIGQLIESHKHEIGQFLHEALEHEPWARRRNPSRGRGVSRSHPRGAAGTSSRAYISASPGFTLFVALRL